VNAGSSTVSDRGTLGLDGGDVSTDITGGSVRILAGNGIGTLGAGADALEISATTDCPRWGRWRVLLGHGLCIGSVAPPSIRWAPRGDDGQDRRRSGRTLRHRGGVVLHTTDGNIVVNADGTGNGAVAGGFRLLLKRAGPPPTSRCRPGA
jgi:hypothetical protein